MCTLIIEPLLVLLGARIENPGVQCEAAAPILGAYSCSRNANWQVSMNLVNPSDGSTVQLKFVLCEAHLRPYSLGKRECGVHHEPFEVKLAA
jgi:hypothetical protein